jgi:undecaprenyl-diphosphatase
MAVARNLWGFIDRRDQRLMRRMNRWRAPRWFRIWMIAATRMGDGWIWYGLGLMLLAFGGPQRFSAIGAAGRGLARSSHTAGRRSCPRTSFRFHRATR